MIFSFVGILGTLQGKSKDFFMNELDLFEKKMTVKELAGVLSLDERTIQLKVKELFPSLVANGKKTVLTEKQVTLVKLELEKKFEVKTQLEKEILIQQALFYQQEKINSMQLELTEAKVKLLEQTPKVEFYDTVSQTNGWYNAKQLSNMLAIPELGRNNLLKRLRDMKYLTEYNKPYQKWIDQKLMKLAEDKKGYTFAIFSQKFIDRIIKEIK